MSDDIASRQNSPDNIERLAAQRHLYARAKRLSAAQATLAGAVPIIGAIALAVRPSADAWVGFAGIAAALLDTVVLDPIQKSAREFAARVQEDFDCRVLALPWNGALAGHRPSAEDIHDAAGGGSSSDFERLHDWYPPVVGRLPLYQGRVICQRTNCWWDSKLRRRYGAWILAALLVVSTGVLVGGLVRGMSLQQFVLAVLAPLLPAALWATREWRRQRDAASSLDRLKDYGHSMWSRVVNGEVSEPEISNVSEELQSAIFVQRRENPLVFDWVYKRLRNTFEEQMNVGAEAMVKEIEARN